MHYFFRLIIGKKNLILRSFVLLLYLLPLFANAQSVKWNPNRPLKWSDFAGVVDESIHQDAFTHCTTKYTCHWTRRNNHYQFNFTLNSGFDSQSSWCRKGKQTDLLLKHEQLHFDIHELYTRKIFIALNQGTYTDNYKNEIETIFRKMLKECQAVQDRYDDETDHSRIRDKQLEWEARIKAELIKAPLYVSSE